MSRPPSGSHEDAAQAALRRVRREGRWWWVQAWHARRIWRWALLAAAAVFLLLVLLRAPLANWFWSEPQVEQLLDRGDRALAAGRLTANDGSGAREWYQAALALDGDRVQARTGLARTAQAALEQARRAVQSGDLNAAQRSVALARELQVPQREADAVADAIRAQQQSGAGFGVLLGRAEAALQAQRLDGGEDSALPLFQQVLALAPNHVRALEGREDALTALLQQARTAAAQGDVARAAPLVRRARMFDAGHVDLPATEAALNNALERRLRLGQQALKAERWDSAASHFEAVLAARPDEPAAQQGLQQVGAAWLAEATRLAGDFRFAQAGQLLVRAEAVGAPATALDAARRTLEQSRQAEQALRSPSAPRARRAQELQALLQRYEQAQTQGRFLTPPGNSAYDALRAAQALATHGSCEPQTPGQLRALRDCAERILGELRLGMRPHLLHAADILEAVEREVLRDSVAAHLSAHARDGMSLLEYLGAPLVARGVFAWHEVHRLRPALAEMARSPRALRLHTALLDALGWHGAALNATTSPTLLGSLTVQAVLTDLGPASVRAQRIVLGYRMHKHANHGRTFAAIREDFATYLGSLGRLPAPLLPMAVALALQEEAPELAAADIPAPLVFGSAIASVDYASGVHLAEHIQRGLSAQMNFSTLLTLWGEAADDPQLPAQARQMVLDARQVPLFDWWTFRDLGGNESSAYAPSTASAMFDARVRRIDAAISHLLAPLPYRMPMVEAELTRVFPVFPGVFAGLQWNASTLRLCKDALSFPLFELYAAGALLRAPQDWHPCRHFVPDTPMSRAQGHAQHSWQRDQTDAALQRGFARLANITADFQRAFDAYFQRATDGYGVLVEEALYLRPEDERQAITRGEVEIFTLRTHTELEAGQETRNDTDHLRGRFGVIYALRAEGRRHYFQLFPLHSRILPLALEGELPVGGALEARSVRLRHGRHATVQVRRGTPLPLDWQAYASYQPPVPGRTSTVIVERLPVQSDIAAGDAITRSPFHALVAPLQRDFFWLDRFAFLHEARAPTSFEAHLKSPPLWLQAVEFVVPFVANLRKITSADRDEFALAAFGLYLEGVLITWPISGSVFKVLARPGARLTLPRVNELAAVVGKGMLDALNPAAGVIAATRLGVSVVQHGVGGGVRFIWSRLQGSPLRAAQRGLHLFDPATLTPYGPVLRQGSDSGSAAGVLFKVGEGLRVKPSVGKALKPIKQGSKASQEDSGEALGIPSPPRLEMPVRAGTP